MFLFNQLEAFNQKIELNTANINAIAIDFLTNNLDCFNILQFATTIEIFVNIAAIVN